MWNGTSQRCACGLAVVGAVALGGFTAQAQRHHGHDEDGRLGTIFVIAMENHNWTQPAGQASPQQIFANPNAPFINSLVNGTSGISDQVSYATNYINAAVGSHPSEPNYIWAEAGTNFGVNNDNDPCGVGGTQQNTDQHLSAFLMKKHISWKSYQEDTDIDLTSNTVLPMSSWIVPLVSHSGAFTATGALNFYNYSNQFNYAGKHNPMIYFSDTAGGCDATTANPRRLNYAPLQQLALDLQNDSLADYNWITPNQYNDQHTTLKNGFGGPSGSPATGDAGEIAQGDNFLARVVPLIMASDAYKDHGAILLWWDESEGGDDPGRTLPFIVISRDAHQNVGGKPFASSVEYSHSSFLRTMQEVFDVDPDDGFPFLGAASIASDLRALFKPGVVKQF
jgi:phosphatidylinositol-3-phosphatase